MTKRLARRAAAMERRDDARARRVERHLSEARALASLADDKPEIARAPLVALWPARRAMMIINSKSGPEHDSIVRVRELVDLLGTFGITADVRVKLRKSQARKEARAAARSKAYDLVIAAGGDGTVEAIASGLIGTRATLGIIPLGTYNNVATCLGLPTDVREACALIGMGASRRIDVGQVMARHMKKPRIFLELSTVGLGAALGPLGQHLEKGRWTEAAEALPEVVEMSPSPTLVRLDDESAGRQSNSLLVTVSNTPRAGAGLALAPDARIDDGLLDVCIYAGMDQRAVMAQFLPGGGSQTADAQGAGLERARARTVEVHTARPMPVSVESRLVGVTPARFTVLPRALSVVTGHGSALLHPTTPGLMAASVSAARAMRPTDSAPADSSVPAPAPPGPTSRSLQMLVPAAGRALDAAPVARSLAAPVVTALVGIAAGWLWRPRSRRFFR
ncbi:MAG TPA: YegS/Rv2252/BmrU family lipid kinase [Chloroflexota bacterium]